MVKKNPPAKQETWVLFMGREDPLGKEMATYSSILAWKIPWTEEPGELQSPGWQKSRTKLSDQACTQNSRIPVTVNWEFNRIIW